MPPLEAQPSSGLYLHTDQSASHVRPGCCSGWQRYLVSSELSVPFGAGQNKLPKTNHCFACPASGSVSPRPAFTFQACPAPLDSEITFFSCSHFRDHILGGLSEPAASCSLVLGPNPHGASVLSYWLCWHLCTLLQSASVTEKFFLAGSVNK